MNKKNIRRLALAILTAELARRKRGTKIGFNMVPFIASGPEMGVAVYDKTGFNCGTVACIAGTQYLLDGGSRKERNSNRISTKARKALGLNEVQASELFAPDYKDRLIITPQRAALVLFNLAETGLVDWSVA